MHSKNSGSGVKTYRPPLLVNIMLSKRPGPSFGDKNGMMASDDNENVQEPCHTTSTTISNIINDTSVKSLHSAKTKRPNRSVISSKYDGIVGRPGKSSTFFLESARSVITGSAGSALLTSNPSALSRKNEGGSMLYSERA
jgi:hypothetical protein